MRNRAEVKAVSAREPRGAKHPLRYRLAGLVALLGVLAGYAGGVLMHFPPFAIQRLLQNPIANAGVVLIGFGTVASLALWAQRPDSAERRAFVVPIMSVGGLAVVVNVLAPALGLWGGPVVSV